MIDHSEKTLILIDCCYVLRRYYHACEKSDVPIMRDYGGLYGLYRLLFWIKHQYPNHICVSVFDTADGSFRRALSPEYKNNRKKTPPPFIEQCNLARTMCTDVGVKLFDAINGNEADDIIASYAKNQILREKYKIIILSYDKDLMQLIDSRIYMIDPVKKTLIDVDFVRTRYGILPEQLSCYLSLVGDRSDNVKGATGIGAKIASSLIQKYNSLENIYQCIQQISSKNIVTKLLDSKPMVFLAKQLITLKIQDVPIEDIEQYLVNTKKITDFGNMFNFKIFY